MAFLDRQLVLRILYDHIADQPKILLGKKVVTVDYASSGVVVHCEDGTQYAGDIVTGADGVHSTVRKEMWRYADACDPPESLARDKTGTCTLETMCRTYYNLAAAWSEFLYFS